MLLEWGGRRLTHTPNKFNVKNNKWQPTPQKMIRINKTVKASPALDGQQSSSLPIVGPSCRCAPLPQSYTTAWQLGLPFFGEQLHHRSSPLWKAQRRVGEKHIPGRRHGSPGAPFPPTPNASFCASPPVDLAKCKPKTSIRQSFSFPSRKRVNDQKT